MSLENDAQLSLDLSTESNHESQKKFKITYARDFLLALSGLDVCKKLPRGFDQSILSEFEDAPQDRPRLGGLSFRRNEYGSSPPTRGDTGSFSRGIHGRWDNRSSGRSERDNDSQSELDSDSGKRYGNQTRPSWQVPEHDGLLGSGSFPRPSGYVAGASVPKPRVNDQQIQIKSNEPYHPPRPFKALPHPRRDTDSLNDETFGSSEYASDDRAEEERKRRVSFELMRKEQQKAFQEKQILNLDKPKDDFDTLAEDSKDEKILLDRNNISNEPMIPPAANNDSGKSSLSSQTAASRPRVPPGFAKNFGGKSIIHPRPEEARNPEVVDSQLLAKGNRVVGGISDNLEEKQSIEQMGLSKQQMETTAIHVAMNNNREKTLNVSTTSDDSDKAAGMNSQLHKTFNISEAFEVPERRKVMELDPEQATRHKELAKSNPEHSGSILEKLFGNALPLHDGGPSTEPTGSLVDEVASPPTVHSSKFAQWFLEEEKKPVENLLSGRPNDLLSLIVGGEKVGSLVSDVTTADHIPLNFPLQSSGLADGLLTSSLTLAPVGNAEQLHNKTKPDMVPAVLTCEDLEQSILSEICENAATLPQPVQGWGIPNVKTEQPKVTDNSASQHLLSLLQKGTGLQGMASSAKPDTGSSGEPNNGEVASIDLRGANTEKAPSSGNSLTLETLFGTAFMKELQSVGAPVSAQRGSVGSTRTDVSEPHGLSFSIREDSIHPSAVEVGPNRIGSEGSVLASNQRWKSKSDTIGEHWLGFDDPRIKMDPVQTQTDLGPKLGQFDGLVEVRLPEEDSLIINESVNLQNFMAAGNSAKAKLLNSLSAPADLTEKLAALNSAFKDERSIARSQEGPLFPCGLYDVNEPDVPYQNIHGQTSAQHHPPQLNHVGTLFHHPLGSHPANINSPMKFLAPEGVIRHDTPNHQFPPNMIPPPFHHPSTGLSGFDPPSHHHPMLQQMHMAGNVPPPHLIRGFPRGGTVAPHPNNQTGFIPEPSQMQGFPHGHRQLNFGGTGISPPVPDGGGSNHPDAFRRLIERELRSNSKQIHPYGHELDMGFGFR